MKNFDEIYKKVCGENLKGTKYTITTVKKSKKIYKYFELNKIFTFLGIIMILIFMVVWLILAIDPDNPISHPTAILGVAICFFPITSMLLFAIARYLKQAKNSTLKNPNKSINIKISDTIFDEIRLKNLNETRAKNSILAMVIIIGFILSLYLRNLELSILILFLGIPTCVVISSFLTNKKDYEEVFKNNIITSLIKNYDNHLQFNATKNMSKQYYNLAEFEHYDYFYSNDYISGKINGIIPIQLGDVETTHVHTDSDGHSHIDTLFRGLFSIVKLPKSFPSIVTILSDKANVRKIFPDNETLKIDSIEFEKHFNIFTKNKILAMQLLTSDIMDSILDFKTQNNSIFEIVIKDSFAYIRIHCDDMFEANLSKNAFDYDTLYTYYKYLDFICEINKKIFNIIKEKDL